MRWPWHPGSRARRDEAEPASAVPPAPASTPALPTGAWRSLPPLQRTTHEPEPVCHLDTFSSELGTHQDPRFLEPLGHYVDAAAPSGEVAGLARPAPAPAPDPALRPARTVQRTAAPAVESVPPADPGPQPADLPRAAAAAHDLQRSTATSEPVDHATLEQGGLRERRPSRTLPRTRRSASRRTWRPSAPRPCRCSRPARSCRASRLHRQSRRSRRPHQQVSHPATRRRRSRRLPSRPPRPWLCPSSRARRTTSSARAGACRTSYRAPSLPWAAPCRSVRPRCSESWRPPPHRLLPDPPWRRRPRPRSSPSRPMPHPRRASSRS